MAKDAGKGGPWCTYLDQIADVLKKTGLKLLRINENVRRGRRVEKMKGCQERRK